MVSIAKDRAAEGVRVERERGREAGEEKGRHEGPLCTVIRICRCFDCGRNGGSRSERGAKKNGREGEK
jgi:hypothetical protein